MANVKQLRQTIHAVRAGYPTMTDEDIETYLDEALGLSNTFFDDVSDFLFKYDVPVSDKPALPSKELMTFGFKHLFEELNEIENCINAGDLVGVADGLGDLVYVALNFAARMGIPFNEVWDAIHKANMEGKRKVKDASESKRGYEHDVIKDTNFISPEQEIWQALTDAGW